MSNIAQMAQRTKAEQEAAEKDLMKRVEDLAAGKSAPKKEEFLAVDQDDDRFEAKAVQPEKSPEEEEESSSTGSDLTSRWSASPSIRNQIVDHPDSVRLVEPQSKVIDPSDPDQLKELNRIQRESNKEQDPTLAITDYERKFHDGKWSVFLTYAKVQYRQL